MPVEGPARWMLRITSGSSAVTARPMPSPLRAIPGPVERGLQRPRVDPRDEAEREEVLRAVLLLGVELEVGDGLVREAGHVDLVQTVALGERGLVERVLRVAGLVEVALLEGRGVDDQ